MTHSINSIYRDHPSAAQVAERAKNIINSGTMVQSRAYISCSRLDVESYLRNDTRSSLMFRSRLRSGTSFLDHHDIWILEKFPQLPKEIDIFCYYTIDIGVPLRITGLYNTRVEVKWLNKIGRVTEEPSTWLQMIDEEGLLPRKIYYGDGFRYEI